jgi:hypothetical protein
MMKSRDAHSSKGGSLSEAESKQFAEQVESAANRAVQRAIAEHHRAGDPVVIWRNGQLVQLYPDGSVRAADGRDVPLEDGRGC